MQARDMLYDPAKHKTVQHYNVEGHTHYLTFSCHDGLPLLTNELWLSWLSAAINKALARHRYNLTSFVYMPEHVHLIVWPRDEKYCIEDFLYAVKKPFSDRMKKMLQQPESSLFRKLSSVEGAGKTAFRFWQKGPGTTGICSRRRILSRLRSTFTIIPCDAGFVNLLKLGAGLVGSFIIRQLGGRTRLCQMSPDFRFSGRIYMGRAAIRRFWFTEIWVICSDDPFISAAHATHGATHATEPTRRYSQSLRRGIHPRPAGKAQSLRAFWAAC